VPTDFPREETTYIIDTESGAETTRLMFQDNLLTRYLGGLFPVELDKESAMRVLDLACGPGGWVLNVAYDYPKAEVYGDDINQGFVRYAKAQAWSRRLDNAYFEVMDILKPLAFEENSFDVVNARLLYFMMPTRAWPGLLNECMRILRPGGLLCLCECETGISNAPYSEQLNRMLLQTMQKAGMSFSPDGRNVGITPMLSGLIRDAGFVDIGQKAEAIDFSAGAPAHDAFCENIMVGAKLAQPFMLKMGITTPEELERVYQCCLEEMNGAEFRAIWYYLRAWGRKP
jgi:ubiquinone/menaquinone biosynthesis C-methylase UbiE